MGDQTVTRRLAAVLAADVAGYTRLMEKDTDGTVAAWQAARQDVIRPRVAEHSGRIVKLTGDGFLVEFPTVQDAVRCAISMQAGLASSHLKFRMGVNLGDIVDDGEDIHGEGVNIAARIEALADEGGINISGMVYESIRNRIDATYEDRGEHDVKNVSAPVRVYAIRSTVAEIATADASSATKPSIAVLPFDNLSRDSEQGYFADGISEDIITDLSKVSGLMVIARNSSFAYRGKSPDLRQVCRDLDIRFVLEGSVRRAGNRVRINAQLIDGVTGGHVWAERYDRNFDDIFALQDDITGKIVAALKVTLTPGDMARIEHKQTDSPEAYDHVLRGRSEYYHYSPKSIAKAAEHFAAAIELDPGFAEPYGYLSYCCFARFAFMMPGADPDLSRALDLAEKAVALDPQSAIAHTRLGWIQGFLRKFDDSIASFEKALVLDPNNAESHAAYAEILNHFGDPERALELNNRAIALDTSAQPNWIYNSGHALLILRRYDEAIEKLEEAIAIAPHFQAALARLACAYAEADRPEDARRIGVKILEINPRFSMAFWDAISPHRIDEQRERFRVALRAAGLPE